LLKKDFMGSLKVVFAFAKTSNRRITFTAVFCLICRRCQDSVLAFWQAVSIKGHSQCIKNVFFLTDIKMWPLNDSCYQGSWTRKSIGCSWRGGINAGQIDHLHFIFVLIWCAKPNTANLPTTRFEHVTGETFERENTTSSTSFAATKKTIGQEAWAFTDS